MFVGQAFGGKSPSLPTSPALTGPDRQNHLLRPRHGLKGLLSCRDTPVGQPQPLGTVEICTKHIFTSAVAHVRPWPEPLMDDGC